MLTRFCGSLLIFNWQHIYKLPSRCLRLIHYFSNFGKRLVLFARDSIMLRMKGLFSVVLLGNKQILILHVGDKFFFPELSTRHCLITVITYCFNSISIGFSVCQVSLYHSVSWTVVTRLCCFVCLFFFPVEGLKYSTAWRWLTRGVRDWKDVIPFQTTPSSPMPGAT